MFRKARVRHAVPMTWHKGELWGQTIIISTFGVFRRDADASIGFIEITAACDELPVLGETTVIIAAGPTCLRRACAGFQLVA